MASRGVQGPTVERLEKAERVRELRESGLTHRQIAERLGLSRSYTAALDNDPEGTKARARKDSYGAPCPRCGKQMSGSNGLSRAPMLCKDCTPAAAKTWTRERIIESFQEFYRSFGRAPTSTDVIGRAASQRSRFSDSRIHEIDEQRGFHLPVPWAVAREFGSWPSAVRAAGFTPSSTGGPMHREHAFGKRQTELLELLADGECRHISDLATTMGCSGPGVQSAIGPLVERGFIERVSRGVYRRGSGQPTAKGRRVVAREFIVLSRNGVGWLPTQTVEAPTAAAAIEKVATGEGEYVAVPVNYWNELRVGTVTKLAVIQEAATA